MIGTSADRLRGINLKLERAKHHMGELESLVRAFNQSHPYKVATKRDPDTRKLIYYVASVECTPEPIPVLAGEVINGLRSVLDHLAVQLVLATPGGGTAVIKRISFPIYDDAAKYASESPGRIKGMRPDAMKAIDDLEPYKGGKGHQFWVLHELNNIDKHRLLLTVGSTWHSMNLGAHLMQLMRREWRDSGSPDIADQLPEVPFFVGEKQISMLKVGDELFIGAPDEEPNAKMQFKFAVSLGELQVTEPEPLLALLHRMAGLVDATVKQLATFL